MDKFFQWINLVLHKKVLNNLVLDYLVSLAVLILGIILINIFKSIILRRIRKFATKTKTQWDDFLIQTAEKTILPLSYFGVFYLSLKGLYLQSTLNKTIHVLGLLLFTYAGINFVASIVEYWIRHYWVKRVELEEKERKLRGLIPAIRMLIWIIGIVFLLDNLGFKISTVVATLGIGGIAVALAAQAILKDLFSYFSIMFDRPFELGDFVIIDQYMGTVENIGIKTTRIRSLGGEQLVFSNADLTDSRLRNYKRMERRRVVFEIGVTYQTGLEHMKEIPVIIKKVIEVIEEATFDRAHFSSFGDFSLNFEIVYYVEISDYARYMDIQQEINLALKEEFEKRGIEFAYPTQTLFLAKEENGR